MSPQALKWQFGPTSHTIERFNNEPIRFDNILAVVRILYPEIQCTLDCIWLDYQTVPDAFWLLVALDTTPDIGSETFDAPAWAKAWPDRYAAEFAARPWFR